MELRKASFVFNIEKIENVLNNRWLGYFIQFMVVLSISLYIWETDMLHTQNSRVGPPEFLWAERTIAGLLTIEYLLRLIASKNRIEYIKSTGIIDLLAILPFWLGFFVPFTWLGVIRACRVLRLMKFYRYNSITQRLFKEFAKHDETIKVIAFMSAALILFMSCGVYELEKVAQPDKFGTIIGTVWFSFISATTIGYGDMAPITTAGKVFSSFCSVLSVCIYASWIAIIGTVVHNALRPLDEEEDARELLKQGVK